MKPLVPSNWCLTQYQKDELKKLFELNEDDEDLFYSNIECQIRWMAAPTGYKPANYSEVTDIIGNIEKLIVSLKKLIDIDYRFASTAMVEAIQVVVNARQILESEKEEKVTKNAIFLNSKQEEVYWAAQIPPDFKPLIFPEKMKVLAKRYSIDLDKERSSYIYEERLSATESNEFHDWTKQKVDSDSELASCLAKIDLSIDCEIDPVSALEKLKESMCFVEWEYSNKKKLDFITSGLFKALFLIPLTMSDGSPIQTKVVLSSSPKSKFIQYIEIVIQDIADFRNYRDLRETIAKSVERSDWFKTQKLYSK
ncbi:MAG: hypothetical protein ACJAS1_006265 [Oleiphilaceae bacterium]|jgi:hypothetical protein